MELKTLRADLLLLLTAVIWGSAFVAQVLGMDHIGPLTFSAIRFALGAVSLLPLIWVMEKRRPSGAPRASLRRLWKNGLIMGVVLFCGANLQQWGLLYTTAGNAGFITGLYVVLVPLFGLFFKQKTGLGTWVGAVLAVWGMYLLSVTDGLSINFGDALVCGSAFFWAAHVLIIGHVSGGIDSTDAVKVSSMQFACCAVLSAIAALVFEEPTAADIINSAGPLLFGGVCSCGIAYTLQVVAQHDAPPAHAAIILSLEAVFAVAAGFLFLHEIVTLRSLIGCGLMLSGMFFSQLKP